MNIRPLIVVFVLGAILGVQLSGKKGEESMKPALISPHRLEIHGDVRVDNYFWMRERDSKPVLEYLRQENAHTAAVLAPYEGLEKKLYGEMRSRIKEDDASVPVFDTGYFYYTRYEPGQEYPLHARKKGSVTAAEEIILDENFVAKGQSYFDLGSSETSPDQSILAYAADTIGRRKYTIRFKRLSTGEILPDHIDDVTDNFVWAADNKTVFYVKQDPETLRAFQVCRYELGQTGPAELVYEEKDDTFNVNLGASRNGDRIYLGATKRDSTEWRILDAHQPKAAFQIFLPREMGHEYFLEDGGDRVYVLTNWKAKNFRVMEAPLTAHSKDEWREVLPHDPQILREELAAYASHLVVSERSGGLSRIRVFDRKTGTSRLVDFKEEAYEVENVDLPDYNSTYLRFAYESLVQPPAVYDEDMASANRELKKEREVPGYDKSKYETKRIWATAPDGVKVPVSLIYKKGLKRDGRNPSLLYGYGSYGLNNSVQFWGGVFSLVDRGFVFAEAHIRGGQEMGRDWYEQGRLKHKMNTFTDFIAAAELLNKEGYTSPAHTHIMGGSAGGLLMGAVMNMRPDLFKSVIALVPFVDVLTTMLDESIPLTTGEYNEWGDPRKKDDYLYMKQYSPYDNVVAKDYPNLFVQTGYHDSQVQYWEPAKWVAKLRELKTDKNEILFLTEMDTGHSGASGRFEALKTLAKEFTFILMLEGIRN